MGIASACCTTTACTRTYSHTYKKDANQPFPLLSRTKANSVEMPPCSSSPSSPSLHPKYKFPKFCKILKSVTTEDIRAVYTFEKRLGVGKFGVVNQVCLNKDNKKKFAVKSIKIESILSELELIENELEILQSVDHPNIIKYYETYNDGEYLHIVTELCTGGELFERIVQKGKFTEQEAARITEKILSAISFLHNLGICHRDIKPENFMFSSVEPDAEIKIIDFGLSTKFIKEHRMRDIVGTPYYVAPEVLEGVYTNACDVWSVGVVLYIMLDGRPPFNGTSSEVLSKVAKAAVFFPERQWRNISTDAKDLILKMLEKNVEKRYTAKQCLDHSWFQKHGDTSFPQLDVKLLNRLKNYKKQSRFKQEVLGIVTKFLHPLVVKYYTNNFRAIDQNEDGYISVPDLIQSAKENNIEITEAEATQLLQVLDFDKNGHCSISDFVAASVDKKFCSEEIAKLAFDHFDVQKDGFITVMDLITAFQRGTKKYTDKEIEEILGEVDLDKDGKITFQQFKEILLSQIHDNIIKLSRDYSTMTPQIVRNVSHTGTMCMLCDQ
eukprot:TRINITY_DN293_c0_g1_i1.p1 TRINITY_DN293_c0_g1~~TRINITY_DN293_c0_g1_i1.p1  ORF type:complete len:552 (+),score=64.24 TRINITY_DN293_c0_g1_i1:2543-4198(+)